jgi:hypothetical protein
MDSSEAGLEDQRVERGAAEEGAGAPVTETEVDASRRPPSAPDDTVAPDDAGMAGGASGGGGGGSGMARHPDGQE